MANGEFSITVKGIGPHHSGTDDVGSTLSFLIANLEANGCRILDARFAASGYVEENWKSPSVGDPRTTYDGVYNT